MKKRNFKEILGKVIVLSFIVPIGFIVYRIYTSPISNELNEIGVKVKTDYILMLLQCILGLIALILPYKILKKEKLEVPPKMYIAYMLFLWASVFFR